MPELWDVKRVAAYLGVSERTVYQRVRSGELPAVRVGRVWRVRADDVERWLEGTRVRYQPRERPPAVVREGGPERKELDAALESVGDPLERRLLFVGVLSRAVEAAGWQAPVIVGGNAVEFYTAGDYATVDIDLVAAQEPLAQILPAWGFRREGRHWIDDELGLVVEAPGSQLEPSSAERVLKVEVGGYVARVLGIEDLIVDRLAACVHWRHEESCEWARALIGAHGSRIDMGYLRARAADECMGERLEKLLGAES